MSSFRTPPPVSRITGKNKTKKDKIQKERKKERKRERNTERKKERKKERKQE